MEAYQPSSTHSVRKKKRKVSYRDDCLALGAEVCMRKPERTPIILEDELRFACTSLKPILLRSVAVSQSQKVRSQALLMIKIGFI